MPTPRERNRNNVRVGIFVTISLALALGVISVLSDAWESWLRPTHAYTVTFPLSPGVKNLKEGADVRIGGLQMGKVKNVHPAVAGDAFGDVIEVEFTLDRRARLFSNANIAVSAALIGSDAWLDVSDLGGTMDNEGNAIAGAAVVPPGGLLTGRTPEGLLASVLGAQGAEETGRIVTNVAEFSEFLATAQGEYDTQIKPIIGDVGGVVREVKDDYAHWRLTIDDVMTRANAAAESLERAMAGVDEGVASVNAMVADNRPSIDEIIANLDASGVNIRDISDRLAGETMDKFDQLITRGQDGVDSFARTLEQLEPEVDVWVTEIREGLANARLTAQQLKLASIEVRRSPWKLLYRPSATELEHELLYEAARSFAVAASDLKTSSEALQRVMTTHGERLDQEQPALRRLYEGLHSSFERYEEAQRRLLDVLVTDE
jgi:ABC-type transporter Mla subunit MlaD